MKQSSVTKQTSSKLHVRPTGNDIKCGRGVKNFVHPGNGFLRALIETKVGSYQRCTAQCQKTMVIADVIGTIFKRGGRFLKLDYSTRLWYDGGLPAAKLRVGIAFRDAVARKKKQAREETKCVETNLIKRNQETNCGDRVGKKLSNGTVPNEESHQQPKCARIDEHTLHNEGIKMTGLQESVNIPDAAATKAQKIAFDNIKSVDIYCVKGAVKDCSENDGTKPLKERRPQEKKDIHQPNVDLDEFNLLNASLAPARYQGNATLQDATFERNRTAALDIIGQNVRYNVKADEDMGCGKHGCEQPAGRTIAQDVQEDHLDSKEFKWLKFRVSVAFRDAVARRRRNLLLGNLAVRSAAILPVEIKSQEGP